MNTLVTIAHILNVITSHGPHSPVWQAVPNVRGHAMLCQITRHGQDLWATGCRILGGKS